MRLKHIKGAKEIISKSPYLIENLFSEEDTIKFGLNNNNYETNGR